MKSTCKLQINSKKKINFHFWHIFDLLSVCSPRIICDSRSGINFCSVDGIGWEEWVVCVVCTRDGKQLVVIADVLLPLLVYRLYRSLLDH